MNPEEPRASSETDLGTQTDRTVGSDNDDDDGAISQEEGGGGGPKRKSRTLPDDLPKSLDDRRSVPVYAGETEMYDGWQGTFKMPMLQTTTFLLLLLCHDTSFSSST